MRFKKEYQYLLPKDKKRIIRHFKLEAKYAAILKNTPNPERSKLYKKLYDEFYERIPDNTLKLKANNKNYVNERTQRQIKFLLPYLNNSIDIIEIGSGDFSLTVGLSPYINSVVGVDVSSENIPINLKIPKNVKISIINDGATLPKNLKHFHIAYSNQLLEHFHPEDAVNHLSNVFAILRKEGKYIFQTPHKYFGPHDVSKYFYDAPMGFHLKEYSNLDLYILLDKVGFRNVKLLTGFRGYKINLPIQLSIIIELFLALFPYRIRKSLSLWTPFRKLINGHVIGTRIN
tara:strand:- start:146 stop:1009 length:864 start_codon:yes stop_codon:yes gene_type:complete